jgi:hypothetical protein
MGSHFSVITIEEKCIREERKLEKIRNREANAKIAAQIAAKRAEGKLYWQTHQPYNPRNCWLNKEWWYGIDNYGHYTGFSYAKKYGYYP